MSDAGPLPEPRGRRRWLWIAVGILGACLVLCLLVIVWANTIGEGVLSDLSTRVAVQATSQPRR
jgi:ABC-type transporter Mla subunit MlaD